MNSWKICIFKDLHAKTKNVKKIPSPLQYTVPKRRIFIAGIFWQKLTSILSCEEFYILQFISYSFSLLTFLPFFPPSLHNHMHYLTIQFYNFFCFKDSPPKKNRPAWDMGSGYAKLASIYTRQKAILLCNSNV